MQVRDGIPAPSKFDDGSNVDLLQRVTLGWANIGHVHKGVFAAPLALAAFLELAVVAVVAWLGLGGEGDLLIQEFGELAAQPTPIRTKLLDHQ